MQYSRYGLPALSVFAFALAGCSKNAPSVTASAPSATPVSAARVERRSVPRELRVVGTVQPSATVEIKSQVAGPLHAVRFREGQNVTRGTLLFEIDKRPFLDALRQAEAALARDRAQVAQAEAMLARDQASLRNAEVEAERNAELLRSRVISKQLAEQTRTAADVARESVKASTAGIATARASVDNDLAAIDRAKLDISYSEIRAPISGRTGNVLIHAGNLVKANDAALVVINQLAPAFVTFSVPEEHLSAIRSRAAGRGLAVRATPSGDSSRSAEGQLSVIDNAVDRTTGTIPLKATFANADGMLWPGQFVNVVLTLDTIRDALVVPVEAIQTGPRGTFVYRVTPNNTAEVVPVTVAQSGAGQAVVSNGIAEGEQIVTDGQLRLFPGAPVKTVGATR